MLLDTAGAFPALATTLVPFSCMTVTADFLQLWFILLCISLFSVKQNVPWHEVSWGPAPSEAHGRQLCWLQVRNCTVCLRRLKYNSGSVAQLGFAATFSQRSEKVSRLLWWNSQTEADRKMLKSLCDSHCCYLLSCDELVFFTTGAVKISLTEEDWLLSPLLEVQYHTILFCIFSKFIPQTSQKLPNFQCAPGGSGRQMPCWLAKWEAKLPSKPQARHMRCRLVWCNRVGWTPVPSAHDGSSAVLSIDQVGAQLQYFQWWFHIYVHKEFVAVKVMWQSEK